VNEQNIEIITAVRDHLSSFLGSPLKVVSADMNDPELSFSSVELAMFNAAPDQPTIFTTCGLANHQTLDGQRRELVFIAQDGLQPSIQSAVFNLLASMVVFAAKAVPPLNYGGMIAAEEELSIITPMGGLIFFPPFILVDEFHSFIAFDGSSVQLLWMVPIYEREADYAAQFEPQILAKLFGANELNLSDLQRPIANVDMNPEQLTEFLQAEQNENALYDDQPKVQASEITTEQIARFRASNEVIIDVSHRFRPSESAQPLQSPPPQAPEGEEDKTSEVAPAKKAVRFNLNTGEELDGSEVKQRRIKQARRKKTPRPVEVKLSAAEEKQNRIAELKAAAQAAKQRSTQSKDD
jgi:hypothetical protein